MPLIKCSSSCPAEWLYHSINGQSRVSANDTKRLQSEQSCSEIKYAEANGCAYLTVGQGFENSFAEQA